MVKKIPKTYEEYLIIAKSNELQDSELLEKQAWLNLRKIYLETEIYKLYNEKIDDMRLDNLLNEIKGSRKKHGRTK